MYMSPASAARSLDAFFLNAGFQTPGFLEDDLFAPEPDDFADEPASKPRESNPKPPVAVVPPPCGLQEYLKIFGGDKVLATYWYNKHQYGR